MFGCCGWLYSRILDYLVQKYSCVLPQFSLKTAMELFLQFACIVFLAYQANLFLWINRKMILSHIYSQTFIIQKL